MAVKINNRNFERALEKKGQYRSGGHIQQYRGGKKPFYPREIELDATFRKQGGKQRNSGLSKEVIDKRRREKLCFEYGLPGHIASSHRQKKDWPGRKQVSTMGRSGYHGPTKQFNVTYRNMTIPELEERGIHT